MALPSFTYRCCCLGGKIEASKVGITYAIIDKAVAANALVVRDGKVGTGVEVDEEEHVEDGFEQPQHVLVVTDLGVHSAEEFSESSIF